MNVLMIDACPRSDSRTRILAEEIMRGIDGEISVVKLSEETLPVINEETVIRRNGDSTNGTFSDSMYSYAKQFAAADRIIIAAPFWDLSFPAILKQYIEAVMVTGLTFRYSEEGMPIGMCNAKKLYYVTTAGGPLFDTSFGYGYIKTLANVMFGIPECTLFSAENLDIIGADTEAILTHAKEEIRKHLKEER